MSHRSLLSLDMGTEFSERMDSLLPGYGDFIEALCCLTDGQLKEVEESLLKEAPKV